jgi:uncharacterized delta-60 repeat protein
VYSLAVQADGKILVGGPFSTLGDQPRTGIARLNTDGMLDSKFNPAAEGEGNLPSAAALAVQTDGKILVGGRFTTLDGQPRTNIARLNADGTLDGGFNPRAGRNDGNAPDVSSLVVQADGKILVGGWFTTLGGLSCTNLGRLNDDGTLDSTFNPGAGGRVSLLAVQANGKILVGGSSFTTLGGQPRSYLGRLNADGTLDSGFNPGVGRNDGNAPYVSSLVVQADGKILVGGWFTTLGGYSCTNLGRLNDDGALDGTFNPGADSWVQSLAVQTDGKILVGGRFSTLGGKSRDSLGRLNADGTLDSTFDPGAAGGVTILAVQADGKTLVVGNYWECLTLAGQFRCLVGRLYNTEPATQSLSCKGSTITWLRGGTSPEVWRTTFEHTTNGVTWTSLGDGSRIAGGWRLTSVSLPPSGTIRARGHCQNDSSWFVETMIGDPAITTQPAHRTNEAGTTATFSVVAGGTEPLSYQWQFYGTNLAGQTSASLVLVAVATNQAGPYAVVVTNDSGSVTSAVATLTVVPVLTLGEALDAPQLAWSSGGNAPWTGQTAVTHDGMDAAQSGAISDSQETWVETSVMGPGPLSFWWKVSSEPGYDYLEFYTNGVRVTRIAGEVNWQAWNGTLGTGTQVLRWRYIKDSGGNSGQDRGWVDQVSFTPPVGPPVIVTQPTNQTVTVGGIGTFLVAVTGGLPLSYQWRFYGTNLAGQTNASLVLPGVATNQAGPYAVVVTNASGSVTSVVATLTVVTVLTLGEALDAPQLAWSSGGNAPWTAQIAVTHDGVDAAQSGAISHGQETWVETSVVGPGPLSFWWTVSSESGYDFLEFYTNSVRVTRISGEAGWQVWNGTLGTGTQVLRWRYMKDGTDSSGQDRGWVDQVSFMPPNSPPVIVAQPTNQTVEVGGTGTFTVTATNGLPLSYQWRFFGTNLAGQTSASLVLSGVTTNQVGPYVVVVTNASGSVTSAVATLTVLTVLTLGEALDAPQLLWTTDGAANWFAQTTNTHDGVDAAQSGAIWPMQESWLETSVVGPVPLSFWWKFQGDSAFLRFYTNGVLVADLAGAVDWQVWNGTLGTGTQVLRWNYVCFGPSGPGWVDQVSFSPPNSPPVIVAQPTNQTVEVGGTGTFTVTATNGLPLSYQWRFYGTNLAGQTSASLVLSSVTTNQAGPYVVVVINASGSVTSTVATLTVTGFVPPAISVQPQSRTNTVGTTATFTVTAAGNAPLNYQWLKNSANLTNGGNAYGTTSASLVMTNVQAVDAGGYQVVITNTFGSVTSQVATLTVSTTAPGTKRWEFATGGTVDAAVSIGSNGTLYVGSYANKLYALESATGVKRWESVTGGGVSSSPAIGDNGLAYVAPWDGKIYAFDALTGAKRWEFTTGSYMRTSPAIGADGTVYAGSGDNKVYALEGATGSKRWEFATGGSVQSSPAIGADGTVYVGSYDGKVYALDGATGVKRWEFVAAEGVHSSPAIGSNGTIYVGSHDRKVYALDGTTGSKRWEFATGGEVLSSPALGVDGCVYVGSEDGKVYALEGATGAKRWEFPTGGPIHLSSPAVGADGTVYVGSLDGKVYAIDGVTGAKCWHFATGGSVACPPTIGADGTVYVGSNDGNLYALYSSSVAGPANSPWPMFHQNARHTGRTGTNSPTAPVIITQPQSRTNSAGTTATFSVTASGSGPLSYQWRKSSVNLVNGGNVSGTSSATLALANVQSVDAANYQVVVTNVSGSATSAVATLTVVTLLTLGEALDAPQLAWSSGGNAPWTAQTTVTHDGEDAAQSGAISAYQETWVETSVMGPGPLSFWWKVSSESGYDYLEFYTNGVRVTGIAGDVNWQMWNSTLGTGTQVLRWRYMKDWSGTSGQDRGWVDQVSFTPPNSRPVILVNDGNFGMRTNRFGFNLSGTAGQAVIVEGSTNLLHWLPLQTNTLGSGPFYFSDPATSAFPWRFYRARVGP